MMSFKKHTTGVRLLCVFTLFALQVQAQEVLKMMQYNLMYYTQNSGVSDCNSTTNNLDQKDANIRKIFHYVMPDVFCVCEMGTNLSYVERLLNNAINTDGVNYYQHGPLTSYSGGQIANMIYYDSRKLRYHSHTAVSTAYRDINGYKMYYNSTELAHGDTVFITFWIMHLKAGSGETNAAARHVQTQKLMDKLSSLGGPGNHVVSGDFNIYGSEEPAYQEMTQYSNSLYRLYDPIGRDGHWNNNSSFKDIHTQSTHYESDGCFATGGLDDRFDIILVSPYVYYGVTGVMVRPETYHALGQDGNRFNSSIISPANSSIPSDVANALYNQSDHLPVITEFSIAAHVGVADLDAEFYLQVTNPVQDDRLFLRMQVSQENDYHFEVFSMDGKLIKTFTHHLDAGAHQLSEPFDLAHGMYLLKVSDSKHRPQIQKLVK